MDGAQSAQLAEIESLLADRRKIEQWIATLESRREATPAHVYARVHADYTAKCEAAQAALHGKLEAVRDVAASLEQSLAEQEHAIEQRRDVRAEAELRALVGEFGEEEWEKRRSALDDELHALQTARDDLAHELDQLRALLAEAQPGFVPSAAPVVPSPGAAAPVVEVAAEPVPEPTPIAEVEVVAAPQLEYADEPAPLPEVDEFIPAYDEPAAPAPSAPTHPTPTSKPDWASVLSHKPSVLDEDEGPFAEPAAAAAPAPAEPPAPAAPTPPPPPPVPEERDELAFLRSVLGRSTPIATPAPDLEAVEAPRPAVEPAAHTPLELSADEARHSGAFPAGGRPLGAPTPSTAQAARTLSCQECGAMNFPTEWYCEKCGGELAAY